MNNEEKAKKLSKMYARQYRHNVSDNEEFVFSNEEIEIACNKMAEWKDRILEIKVRELLYNSFYEHSHANSHFCTDDFECKNIDEFVNEFVKRLK